jgi:hypothetical protein
MLLALFVMLGLCGGVLIWPNPVDRRGVGACSKGVPVLVYHGWLSLEDTLVSDEAQGGVANQKIHIEMVTRKSLYVRVKT